MQTVLTIAGFDPSSGAGVTADLMVFAAHGLFGTSCITSFTVQSTRGVKSVHPVAPELIRETLHYLAEDLPPVGIKIGMLATAANVVSVAGFLTQIRSTGRNIPIVLDPVLCSSSGRELLESNGIELLRTQLLPLVDWVTPNLDELAFLAGLAVQLREDVPQAARALQLKGRSSFDSSSSKSHLLNVLVTGGHLDPPDDLLLAAGEEPVWLPGKHLASNSTHGTGCAFSSALLSRIVLGDPPHTAALAAKQYVTEAIRCAVPHGSGRGPLNHLWPLLAEKPLG